MDDNENRVGMSEAEVKLEIVKLVKEWTDSYEYDTFEEVLNDVIRTTHALIEVMFYHSTINIPLKEIVNNPHNTTEKTDF